MHDPSSFLPEACPLPGCAAAISLPCNSVLVQSHCVFHSQFSPVRCHACHAYRVQFIRRVCRTSPCCQSWSSIWRLVRKLGRQVKRLQKRARRSNYATGVNSIALFSKDHKDVSSKGRVRERGALDVLFGRSEEGRQLELFATAGGQAMPVSQKPREESAHSQSVMTDQREGRPPKNRRRR